MTKLQHTTIRWSKSFPTVVSVPLSQYTCHYERGPNICKKTFTRQCDLRFVLPLPYPIPLYLRTLSRHQKNHTKPSQCPQCSKRFPSPKDLDRHNNSVHNNTIKYFCPYDYCRDALKPEMEDWVQWGFRRKDHWLKHLRAEHSAGRKEVKYLQEKGIPMIVLKEGVWSLVLGKGVERLVYEAAGSFNTENAN
jgi:hypothetical protein